MSHLMLLAQENNTAQTFFGLENDERFVVLVSAIGCATGVIIVLSYIVGGVVSSIHQRNAEYDLKRDMLDRGMTAEEIAQVIETAPPPEDGVERWIASWSKSNKKSG